MSGDRLIRPAGAVEGLRSNLTSSQQDAAPDVPRSAWQGTFVQDVLPFLTSLGVHATLLIVGILTYRAIVVVAGPPEPEIQAVTPDATVAAALPAGISSDFLGAGTDPNRRAEQDVDATAAPDAAGFSERRGDAFDVTAGDDDATGNPLIGLNPSGFGESGNDGPGGAGRAGSLAPFGRPGGGVPSGSIFRGKDVVRSVAFVCDASGSMLDKFGPLREQLHRSVEALKPIQSFNVIFFQEAQAAGLSKGELLRGVPENKRKAQRFLEDVYPTGQTDPIPALELAFRQKPELIWLLTDGDFPDNAAVLAFIRQRNKDRRVRINTIAFVTQDEGYEKVLRAIAAENGGVFRFVGEAELE